MNVSAVIVTRGDVDLTEIVFSLPEDCELLIWNNGSRRCGRYWAGLGKPEEHSEFYDVEDLAVYGRYAAIHYAKHDLIYVQDDDVVLPLESIQSLVDRWREYRHSQYDFSHPDHKVPAEWANDHLVANQPEAFRHDFYSDHCLVGFGAVFHRDLPEMAFRKVIGDYPSILASPVPDDWPPGLFLRTCDIMFTALTPRVLVDVPYENLDWAEDEMRMYRQNGHVAERTRMLELVRKVRDGT